MGGIPGSSRQAAPSLQALCCSHSPLSPPTPSSPLFCLDSLSALKTFPAILALLAPLHLLAADQCPSPSPGLDGDLSGHVQGSLVVIQQGCRQVSDVKLRHWKDLLSGGVERQQATGFQPFGAVSNAGHCESKNK